MAPSSQPRRVYQVLEDERIVKVPPFNSAESRNPASKHPALRCHRSQSGSTILMTFPVAAFGKDNAPVIDVTRLFSSDVPEFNVRQRLGATALDASRSYIERISPYPENVEAESTLTWTRAQLPAGAAAAPAALAGGMRPGSASVVLHYSMVKLPEKPMMPRLFDDRVGYFTTSMLDYSKEEHRAPRVRYIARWRLEKKDLSLFAALTARAIGVFGSAVTL